MRPKAGRLRCGGHGSAGWPSSRRSTSTFRIGEGTRVHPSRDSLVVALRELGLDREVRHSSPLHITCRAPVDFVSQQVGIMPEMALEPVTSRSLWQAAGLA